MGLTENQARRRKQRQEVRKRAKKSVPLEIRHILEKTLLDYLKSEEFKSDIKNKTTNERLKRVVSWLPYIMARKENISTTLRGMSNEEMTELAELIKSQV